VRWYLWYHKDMSTATIIIQRTGRVYEIRVGRNFIRKGDTVKVKAVPGRPGQAAQSGFLAKFLYAVVNDDDSIRYVEVVGGRNGANRSLKLDRIKRVAQTRKGERRAAIR